MDTKLSSPRSAHTLIKLLRYWTGDNVLLVWGQPAFDFVTSYEWIVAPPKNVQLEGEGFKVIILEEWAPTLTEATRRLFGGVPTLCVNAQALPYSVVQEILQQSRRWMIVGLHLPFWHPDIIALNAVGSWKPLESLKPNGTQDMFDQVRERTQRQDVWLCFSCFETGQELEDCWTQPDCAHSVCRQCVEENAELTGVPPCYHSSHTIKRPE